MIKIKQLKQKLLRHGIISFALIAVAGGLLFWQITRASSLDEQLTHIKQENQTIATQTIAKKEDFEKTLAALEHYNNIPPERMPSDDYDTVQTRIRAARPIIDTLEKTYRFPDAALNFTMPEAPVPAGSQQEYLLLKSTIAFDYKSPTDEYALSFLEKLIDQFPGYLSVKAFTMDRTSEITPGLLQDMSSKGIVKPLVAGKIELEWKTLKKKPDATSTPPQSGM